MATEHIHTELIRSANNKIVCKSCVTAEDKHGNECFCACHQSLKDRCNKCKLFHN
jgi:hypothetical protein